jgi:hypothetical protein
MIESDISELLFLYDVTTFLIVAVVSTVGFFAGSLWADREIRISDEEINRIEFEHQNEIKHLRDQNKVLSEILMSNSVEVERC